MQSSAWSGIKGVPAAAKNPQASAILERVHDVIKTSIRAEAATYKPQSIAEASTMAGRILSSAQHAARCTINKNLGVSPGAMAFGRDMLLPMPAITGLRLIRARRQALTDQANLRENQRRRNHDYTVGDQFLIKTFKPSALQERWYGPFTITQVHSNGTVSYMLNELAIGRVSILRIKPCSAAH